MLSEITERCAHPTMLPLGNATHGRLTAYRAGHNFHFLNDGTDGADAMAGPSGPI